VSNEKKDTELNKLGVDLAQILKEVLQEVVPASIGASTKAQIEQALRAKAQQAAEAQAQQERCPKCHQLLAACKGEHELMVVYPTQSGLPRSITKWFPGCILNGVTYKSRNASHRVYVPKANDFAYWIDNWLKNEMETQLGAGSFNGMNSDADRPLPANMVR